MSLHVNLLHPRCTMEHLGAIPYWLSDSDSREAKEQLHIAYGHGGGWRPFNGFKLGKDNSLSYPGDPPQLPIAEFTFDNKPERVFMYEHAWVAIIYPDRSFEVCRMD